MGAGRLALLLFLFLSRSGGQALAPCNPELCGFNVSNGHGFCRDDGVCECDYAWSGQDCLFPAASGAWGTWTFVASLFGVTVPWLVCVAGLLETSAFLRNSRDQPLGRRLRPLLALAALVLCGLMRPFYYALDPFAWRETVPVCAMWTVDYLSTALLAASFFLVLWGWARVMVKFERLNGARRPLLLLWRVLPAYCASAAALLLLAVAPAAAASCLCDDSNCPALTGDLLFYISYLVLFGLCLLLCTAAASVMVAQLWRFRRSAEHSSRLFRYSFFVLVRALLNCVPLLSFLFVFFPGCSCRRWRGCFWWASASLCSVGRPT